MDSSMPPLSFENPLFVVGLGLMILSGLASFICFIRVLVWLFSNNESTWGIVCLALTILGGGFGSLLAYVLGWVIPKSQELKQTMLIWTGTIVSSIAGLGLMMTAIWPTISR